MSAAAPTPRTPAAAPAPPNRRGVFVEHEATGPTQRSVATELDGRVCDSLRDLCAARGVAFDPLRVGSRVAFSEVADEPTSALVLAVYRSEGWL